MQQRILDLRVFRILRIDPRNDHEVIPTAKQVLMEPITLPDQSRSEERRVGKECS